MDQVLVCGSGHIQVQECESYVGAWIRRNSVDLVQVCRSGAGA